MPNQNEKNMAAHLNILLEIADQNNEDEEFISHLISLQELLCRRDPAPCDYYDKKRYNEAMKRRVE